MANPPKLSNMALIPALGHTKSLKLTLLHYKQTVLKLIKILTFDLFGGKQHSKEKSSLDFKSLGIPGSPNKSPLNNKMSGKPEAFLTLNKQRGGGIKTQLV